MVHGVFFGSWCFLWFFVVVDDFWCFLAVYFGSWGFLFFFLLLVVHSISWWLLTIFW